MSAIGQDHSALELLQSGDDPGHLLTALRSLGGEAGLAVSDYLDLVGNRPLDGFDISEAAALELPDALLRAIRGAVAGRGKDSSDVEDRIADVRNKVPEQHRSEFDELLGEARLTYRLRDERGIYSDIWASGLMRRAVLAGGRRLASRGASTTPSIWSTPASRRCACWSLVRRHHLPTSSRSASDTAPHTPPRRRPHFSAHPLLRLQIRLDCRPPSPD